MRFARWALLLACLPGAAWGQTTGTLRGQVADDRDAPLPGVTILVSSRSQGVLDRGSVTDPGGVFHLSGLPPAHDYVVRASFPGLAAVAMHDVEVTPRQVTTLRLILQPESALRERVEVRARPSPVNLESTTIETRLDSEFLEALPVLGRNYQDVLTLAPGVSDIDGDGNPNIHGARDTDMLTLLDGVSTTDPLTGKIGAQLNIESIQEIEIKTTGASAEFSRAQGGFANIITRSGGNDFRAAFRFYWRGSALDGDGAGIDDPALHAGVGESGLRDLTFQDILPFLSVEGPIVRDRAWFFAASELVRTEEPVNAVSAAFIRGVREFRQFGKFTWQPGVNHRLALSVNYDPQEYLNEGLNSFTREESGYTLRQGGTILTVKETAVLSPLVALETSVSSFDQRPALLPNLGPDSNGNGTLWIDYNRDDFPDAKERDPGEDYDDDGVFDVWEDRDRNGRLTGGEDRDGDGHVTPSGRGDTPGGCEGFLREDINCNGRVDGPEEDRNDNQKIDDTPVPTSLYPYGKLAPQPQDREYTIDRNSGVRSGPHYEGYDDRRKRFTLRQDLSAFADGERSSHDVKLGLVLERESFSRRTERRTIISPVERACDGSSCTPQEGVDTPPTGFVSALLPAESLVFNSATGWTSGAYLQDNFKPAPNLSLGFGLRFDREIADSFGYSFFDPASEAAPFLRMLQLTGAGPDMNTGILRDPIFLGAGDPRLTASPYTYAVQVAALGRLTRHHAALSFDSQSLRSLGILPAGDVDPEVLASRGVSPQIPEEITLTNNNLAPRLSVAWDPAGSGRTKLYATWGRYFDKLFLGTIVGEEGPDGLDRYYLADPDGISASGQPNRKIGILISKSPPSATQVDRGLQTPFSDELTLGFEREIAPEVSLAVTYVHRRFRNQIQDKDVNHTLRFGPDGQPLDVFGRFTVQVAPGGLDSASFQQKADGRPDLYIHNIFFNQVLRIGNYNEARYKALQVSLTRRLARRWQLQGSYTYSRAVGSAEDFQSRLGNDPSTLESEFGYLDYDQRHVVKLNAAAYLPRDWQVGWAMSWGSGLPYSVISRFFALDDLGYEQFRTRYGYTERDAAGQARFVTVGRNSERNRAAYDLNVSARKNFVLGSRLGALSFEVFNVLNSDDLRIFTYEPALLSGADGNRASAAGPRGPLQIDGERRFGRRFQVGLQFEF